MKEPKWTLIYRANDVLINLLKMELDSATISTLVKSETQSGLIAGFGTTQLSELYVHGNQMEHAKIIVQYFENRQKNSLN